MTTKKTARRPKTFWAVLNHVEDVNVFVGKPDDARDGAGYYLGWLHNGNAGGVMCYKDFLRITGIRLECGAPVRLAITVRKV